MNNQFLYFSKNGKYHCLWHTSKLIPSLKLLIPQANVRGDSQSCVEDTRAKGSKGSLYTATIIQVLAKELPNTSKPS